MFYRIKIQNHYFGRGKRWFSCGTRAAFRVTEDSEESPCVGHLLRCRANGLLFNLGSSGLHFNQIFVNGWMEGRKEERKGRKGEGRGKEGRKEGA